MNTITQNVLIELLSYSPDTGMFSRKRYARSGSDPVGSKRKSGHIQISIFGKKRQAHRLAWIYVYGVNPTEIIDHVNGDPSDNRICNLRLCDKAGNKYNSTKKTFASSKYKGVHLESESGMYVSRITVNKKVVNLGRFDSEVDAAIAYDIAAIERLGSFARTNFEVKK